MIDSLIKLFKSSIHFEDSSLDRSFDFSFDAVIWQQLGLAWIGLVESKEKL